MLIQRLRLLNFRQHEDTTLELGPGLTGIIGPNGVGKTTLLEAIAWALYGSKAARGGRDTVRRRGAPPRARVEVEMEFGLGAHSYRVVRTMHGAELYQDGQAAPIANSLDAVSERVVRLLGMTRDEFFRTYFTGQKELAVMAAMKAAERAQFLSRVLGYERIRTAQERVKERRAVLRAKVEGLESGLPDPAVLEAEAAKAMARLEAAHAAEAAGRAALADAERCLAETRPRWESMQGLREAAARIESELRVTRVRADAERERLERLEREIAEARTAAERLEGLRGELAPLEALLAERAELDRLAEAASTRAAQVARLDSARQQIIAVDERLTGLPDAAAAETVRSELRALRGDLAAVTIQATERRAAWVRDAQDAQTKRQHLLDQFHDLKEQREAIMQAGREGACPTCARPLEGEFEKVLGLLDRQVEEVKFNGNYFKQRIEQLKDEPADLTEVERRQVVLTREESELVARLARLEGEVRQAAQLAEQRARLARQVAELEAALGAEVAAYDQARHTEVRRAVARLEPLQLQAERLRAASERGAALAREAETLRASSAEHAERVGRLAAELAALGFSEAAYADARAADEAAERARRGAELGLASSTAEAAAASEAVRAVARRREEREVRAREARQARVELVTHQELDRALSDLRTDLNQTLRPELSALASEFVRELTNGRYTDLELDEDYVPMLLDDGDPKQVISGGEEDVANLALRLAISQMIAERAGQPLSLLILDEIFGSLDEERRASVLELLRSLADRFPQVILITHIDAVREGFDRVVRVGLDVGRGVAVVRDEPLGAEAEDVAA